MRKAAAIAVAAVITGLIVGVVIADSDDADSTTPTQAPELTVPGDSPTDRSEESDSDEPSTGGAPADQGSGGADGGSGGDSGGAAPPADSPENDTDPPPGSPAERFEQQCEQNPGACAP